MTRTVRPSIVDFCDRLLYGVGRTMIVCAMLFLAMMTLLIAIQVVSRNFFNIGLPWADELARFTGLGLVFFTIPILQYHGKHIAVDILSARFKGIFHTIICVLNESAVLVFLILLLMSFSEFLGRAAHFATPAIGMPNWVFYSPPLIGTVVCTVITALRVFLVATGNSPGKQSSTSADEKDI